MASLKQLNPADLLFIAGENGQIYHHTAGLVILDTSKLRRFDFEYFRDRLINRLEKVPHFRWKLHEVLFGLDRPYWVEDENFSWDNHFKRAALPAPGDREALAEVAGHIYARHLDRSKPLWEMWYIEGLEDGKVALLQKTHHCLMDGQGMQKLGELMADFSPRAKARKISPEIANARPGAAPDMRQQSTNALAHWMRFPLALSTGLAGAMGPGLAKRLTTRKSEPEPKPALPKVFFNDEITADRGVVFRTVSLPDIKKVKDAFDVTVNDVVLALVGSSLRSCLLKRGELPGEPLRAGVAVSLRSDDDDEFSNKVTNTGVTLATDLADPMDRLRAISADAKAAKDKARHGGIGIIEIMQALPPIVLHSMVNSLGPNQAVDMVGANLVVSNVRGSDRPMYIAGARLECMYPVSILTSGMGVNITCVSYCDGVDFGVSLAPELFDNPWEIVDELEQGLQEYLALIPSRRRKSAGTARKPRKRAAAKRKS